jgi:TPR repeat protein
MPTYRRRNSLARFGIPLLALVAACLAPSVSIGPVSAFDGKDATGNDKAPLPIFKNPQAALRAGLEGYRAGDAHSAIEALKYAANGGESLARWKLGKMYADGDGVPHDDIKAYEYFSQIVESYDEDNPDRRSVPFVSSAFVAVGIYSLKGIANSQLKPDPERAIEMFQYAATNFGDPNAQYNLARMYLDGSGVGKDYRQAARWLNLAADKGHAPAQALLGQILFTGHEGIIRQRARGLMWLTLAREAALNSKKDQWIVDLYEKAMAAANDTDRQVAVVYVEDHLKKRN